MKLRGRNKVSAEFSMSSMTDIVFLLLIFFMLTSPAITPEALDLILPKAKGKTTNVQNIECYLMSFAYFSQYIFNRYFTVLEVELHC